MARDAITRLALRHLTAQPAITEVTLLVRQEI